MPSTTVLVPSSASSEISSSSIGTITSRPSIEKVFCDMNCLRK